MPDALAPSPLLAVLPSPEQANQESREQLKAFASRLIQAQQALPDALHNQMTTRWSTLFD